MKYACIARHRGKFCVRLMCRVLSVSPSGFYAAQRRVPSKRARRDEALRLKVRTAYTKSRRRYGAPRVHAELEAELVLAALKMALAERRPAPGLVHHSDRGSQYACSDYRALLDAHGLVASMSKKADCWDNAVAESFFAFLEVE